MSAAPRRAIDPLRSQATKVKTMTTSTATPTHRDQDVPPPITAAAATAAVNTTPQIGHSTSLRFFHRPVSQNAHARGTAQNAAVTPGTTIHGLHHSQPSA